MNRGIKVFFISMGVVFLMVILPFLIPKKDNLISTNALATPVSEDVLNTLRPKLSQIPQKINLHQLNGAQIVKEEDYDRAAAYIVLDYDTEEIILNKNLSDKKAIASLTKVMTAVVALDLIDPSDILPISKNASNQIPTKLGLIANQKLTLEESLNGIMLVSANDAAEVIKEFVDHKYGKGMFVEAMNEKAKLIGLKNTHFENPQGFDGKNHYSSVEDLAILTKYALTNYPKFAEIVKKPYQFYPSNRNHKQIDMYNWNGLLGVYPGVLGVKIGNTAQAGYTTIVVAQRDNKKVLVVLLGAPGVKERDFWSSKLLDVGFGKILGLKPANVTDADLTAKYATWKYF